MDVIVDQPNILPAERRKRFAEFQRSGYYCQAMVVVPEESVRQDRATKRVASTGKVILKISDFFILNFMSTIQTIFQKIPEELVKKMKANFYMPKADDGVFNKIRHLELEEDKATALVEQYNSEFKDYVCSGMFSNPKTSSRWDEPGSPCNPYFDKSGRK